jgi:hypothetical protein
VIELYALPLPAAHLHLGPMTLRDALLTLAGPAWELHADDRARQICFRAARRQHPRQPTATAERCRRSRWRLRFREASHECLASRSTLNCRRGVQSLMWLWLIGLSVIVALGYQAMNDQADQERLDSRLQRLEAQATGLAETIEAIQQRPAVATAADLKDTRQILEARAAQVEKSLSGYAAADDLQALRAEIEQIKTRQAAARAAAPAQPRASRTATASKAEPPPLPFRVVGAELRAGERSVSVAPSNGDFTPDQLQVLLPGDAVGPWRLQAIEGNAAVFQAGDQTRRVAIP